VCDSKNKPIEDRSNLPDVDGKGSLLEPEPLIDVYFAESDLEQVIGKHYGVKEIERLRIKLK